MKRSGIMVTLLTIISWVILMWFLLHWGEKINRNQKFGDGNSRYNYKDYVNNKVDHYNKK